MTDHTRMIQIQGEAAKHLIANIRDVVEDDAELLATSVEGETDLIEAIASGVDRIATLNTHCEVLENQVRALKERASRFAAQAERIKSAVFVAMGQAELRKIELPEATLTIRAVPPKVEISNEADVPARFWKAQDPKLDRKAVLDALKSGELVPGASLSNGSETLAIRGS